MEPTSRATLQAVIDGPGLLPLWPDAGRAVHLGRRMTYKQAASGELAPGVPVLRLGARLKVRRSDLLRFLRIEDPQITERRAS